MQMTIRKQEGAQFLSEADLPVFYWPVADKVNTIIGSDVHSVSPPSVEVFTCRYAIADALQGSLQDLTQATLAGRRPGTEAATAG